MRGMVRDQVWASHWLGSAVTNGIKEADDLRLVVVIPKPTVPFGEEVPRFLPGETGGGNVVALKVIAATCSSQIVSLHVKVVSSGRDADVAVLKLRNGIKVWVV